MILQKKQGEFAQNMAKLIQYIPTLGLSCSIGEVFRTPEQAEIYFRQGKGIKNSLHCKKLAVDIHLFDSDGKYITDFKKYEPLGIYWESLHSDNKWGGKFPIKDSVHFQMQDA